MCLLLSTMIQHQIALWKQIRCPFVIPEKIHRCHHADWELIDCDVAGCVVCSRIHVCGDTTHCPLTVYEGRQVCNITGFYARRHVFADNEYVDTVANVSSVVSQPIRKIDLAMIELWVNMILSSDHSVKSIEMEIKKRVQRVKFLFLKAAKLAKVQKKTINVLDICTSVAHSMNGIRVPRLLRKEQLDRLAQVCVNHIAFFCSTFLDALRCSPPLAKTSGFIVGLLYLMRTGMIIYENVEIVPCVEELCYVLPSENQIKLIFKLSTKIMTEVENFIKNLLRPRSRNQLINMGFRTI